MLNVIAGSPTPAEVLQHLVGSDEGRLVHVRRVPARPGETADWPSWVPPAFRLALATRGIAKPWRHQATAASAAYSGEHVVISTGTASGKSLAYQLPVVSRLLADSRATAIYVSPTKALAADQLRSVADFGLADIRPGTYDGDTAHDERDWIRAHARLIFTNPDMLHRAVLPRHAQWRSFLRTLAFVVIDECHTYRGLFGSHVAHVIRRLRRVLARYSRRAPVFILASATTGDPVDTALRLTGLEVREVSADASPRSGVTFALWEPPQLRSPDGRAASGGTAEEFAPTRRSALTETAELLAGAVAHGIRTLAFVRSRRGAEVVATAARRALAESAPALVPRVAAYRAGYLREERRDLERAVLDGTLLGLASTNALELGIDVAGLDAVILAGYPGSVASLWQQAGRAGRSGSDALCVLVAGDDPLDNYLIHHPEALFGRGVEATVLDPSNPYVLAPHLCCAAAEFPIVDDDIELFGGARVREVLDALGSAGTLRRRPTGWYWINGGRPEVDLRGDGAAPVSVVESSTGRLLGTVDADSAYLQVHEGAVYIHQGASYVVDQLDIEDSCAHVHAEDPEWTTHARDVTGIEVLAVHTYVDAGPVGLFIGDVNVTNQVISYQRRRLSSGEFIDNRPLNLPPRQLRTFAVWWTVSAPALERAGIPLPAVPGALHGAEHAAIGLLPLIATCDRWDIGGLSTVAHVDTGAPTVFVYDRHRGGAGFAERAFAAASEWLAAARTVIADCACAGGCPSCVQSPECGDGNHPLDKDGAVVVLDVVLDALRCAPPRAPHRPELGPPTDPDGAMAGPTG